MEIEQWPEDPSKNLFYKRISKWLNRREMKKLSEKLKAYEKYPKENLFKSEVIKPIKGWQLKEIRIKGLRLLGDIISERFWIFSVAQKKADQLLKSEFKKAYNIKNKFLQERNENRKI
ncbi:hypothetical protein HYV12_01390 [Candidatus Dojkabacteria bacterium]|nr:hypothetical protein [Candidatus Dojkabacteria bacterium]